MTEHGKAVEATGTTPRRRFLLMLGGLGAAAGLRVGTRTEAFAATPDTNPNLVWRLDSHWGYAAGPRKKTACKCNACVQHATNKVFATREAAEASRAHTNCVCQVRAVQINPDGYEKLFQGNTAVDLRNTSISDLYRKLLVPSH